MISVDLKQLMKTIEEENVELIHLQFTDITGNFKNVTIMPDQLPKAFDSGISFDGSSIDGFVRVEESDMYLIPDINTFTILPWTMTPREARLICDVFNMDGTPFEGCPRYILKKMISLGNEQGYDMKVGPECEFFLFHTDSDGRSSLTSHDQASYFDLAPIDMGGNARYEISTVLKEMGFNIEASHHEVAPGQHEIDFKYDDALKTADNIMTFRMVVRIIAQRHGLHATFMPKPLENVSGSGMHLNISLSSENNTNVFYDSDDIYKMSEIAYEFMAGILAHAKPLTAILNPTVNSYKRLVAGYEAPVLIAWSLSNRSPLIRIPATRDDSVRIELRSPDPSANPYLALAVTLRAGLDGIEKKMKPSPPIASNLYALTEHEIKNTGVERLPSNLHEAITYFYKNDLIRKAIGDHAFEKIREVALIEWKDYSSHVSSWELDRYLTKY